MPLGATIGAGALPYVANVAALSTLNWWLAGGVSAANCVAAYQPKGALSLATSYVNLANPGTYDAAPGTAPTFAAATGWTFNGSSQYLTTGITPTNNQTWSAIVRCSDVTATTGRWLFGYYEGAGKLFGIIPVHATGPSVSYLNGGELKVAPSASSGVLAVAGAVGYRDGAAESGTIPAGSGALAAVFIGANNNGAANAWINGKIQAFAIYNAVLTPAQVAAISAAMAAL